jgi:hypothetical protein
VIRENCDILNQKLLFNKTNINALTLSVQSPSV